MVLSPTTIKPASGSKKIRRRVGRGDASTRGNYSGRGMNGQRSRSGGKGGLKLKGFKPILQSTPKLRGFKSGRIKPVEITTSILEKNYSEGNEVTLANLIEKKLISKNSKAAKIIVKGDLKKKLTVVAIKCTLKAREIIEKNGGEVK